MLLFRPTFLLTPTYYGNWFLWLYGFIFTLVFVSAFSDFYLFKRTTNIRIPWWMYLVSLVILPFLDNTLLDLLIPIIYALFIYLFVTKRRLSYTYILTNMIFIYTLLHLITGILGPIISGAYKLISPATAAAFENLGAPVIQLFELAISVLIVKQINPMLHRYTSRIINQAPVTIWLFNIFLLSQSIFRIIVHSALGDTAISTFMYILFNVLYLVVMLFFIKVITSFYSYKNLTISQATELKNLQTYTSHIEAMYDDLRRFRHDYKNILLSLKGATESGNINEIREIFSRVVQPTNKELDNHTAVLSHLENIKDLEIKSIVYSKIITAINEHIDVTVEVAEPFKLSSKISITDALRIIAILFDNAINAAKNSPTKKINFSLFSKGQAQYIVIRNSTKEDKVDLHLLTGNFRGVLNNRHSLGLRNLRIILASYPFIQHNSQSNNHYVTQEIIIHN
ncbi:GHKL domain-containing protein [Limosilactobacillus sp. STM2_1]|uniref:GHKL domain-containing protein n=1 Tax=Limosilactobacillus rudii TaxID=2759755 RepID=A0A7W3UL55_9LACO|nr:GHKL domain-containing protein [Limosilactobacillus rudii]MBB1079507.1 GHKL domain-containing protein [Limosilactobacillus rudii]MBB1097553.1 GHKL domain-containing protein [Limosilactobacillus rudii]MCD7134662.1 GHKL domain-containing protein [Limosilactobacillus rudii]